MFEATVKMYIASGILVNVKGDGEALFFGEEREEASDIRFWGRRNLQLHRTCHDDEKNQGYGSIAHGIPKTDQVMTERDTPADTR